MVERTYEETKGRVVCISEEFRVYVGLRLSPLLFITVVEAISRKVSMRDILCKLIYADDLAVVANSEADLQEQLVEWKEIFSKHGLRVSLEKTEVLWVGQQKENLDIRLDGKKLNQTRHLCKSLRGHRHRDGNSQKNTRWGECKEDNGRGMRDRHISRKLKGRRNCKFVRITG